MKQEMNMLTLTAHARARIQQRGIPESILEDLLDFGREEHSHRGSYIVFFDRHAREKLRRACGKETYRRIEPYLDAYAVLGDRGEIVTVGHRTQRIIRH